MKALFVSKNLIGDSLYVGPALRAWIRKQTEPVEIYLQTLPDHVAPLYRGMVLDFLHSPEVDKDDDLDIPRKLKTFVTCYERPYTTPFWFEHTFDVSTAFALSDKKKQHLAESYADLLEVELPKDDKNKYLKPIFIPDESPQGKWMEGFHETLGSLKGCILISMFSASCTGRDPKCNFIPNKQLPYHKWLPLLEVVRSTYPDNPIRFLGAPEHMDDVNKNMLYASGLIKPGECMFGIPLNRLALIMQKAKLLVTLDNGMGHLGASQETPTFLFYPRCLGIHYILPIGNPNLVYVQGDPVYINPAQLVHGLEFAIKRFKAQESR